jgi:uncharacterized protein
VVIGLSLTAPANPTVSLTGAGSTNTGVSYSLGITAAPASGSSLTGLSVNWGDGSALENLAASATTATHTFSSAGNFTISVTVTDANTLTANATKTVAVTLPSPTISVSGSSSVTVNTTYTLTIAAVPVSGSSIAGLSVNWGDGTALENLGISVTSATHTFSSTGNFTVTATVTDANTQIASATQAVTVNSAVTPGKLVISQVYGAGGNAGASLQNDFVELFNAGGQAVNIAGWSVQYASATGTGNFALAATLTGSIAPGQYYLVQLASGGANGATLPSPNTTGTTNMSGTNGKVILANVSTALVCNGSSTACTAADLAKIVDLVGYGTANFFEGAAAAPAPSITTSILRAASGCTDTNNNSSNFAASTGTIIPRNTATTLNICP